MSQNQSVLDQLVATSPRSFFPELTEGVMCRAQLCRIFLRFFVICPPVPFLRFSVVSRVNHGEFMALIEVSPRTTPVTPVVVQLVNLES